MGNTGIMQQIEELLEQGNSSREIIDMGYAPGTVYGVQRRIRRQTSSQGNNEPRLQQAAEQSPDIAPLVEDFVERVDRLEERIETTMLAKDNVEDITLDHLRDMTSRIDLLAGRLEQLPKRCEQLEKQCNEWKEAHNRLTSVVNQNSQVVEKGFAFQRDGSKTTDARLKELEVMTRRLVDRLQANVTVDNQLHAKLDVVEQRLPRFETELRSTRNLALRQPTGEMVSVRLSDKRDHSFKEYKSLAGLVRPHRHSHDLFLGDRWIDLAEPVD